MLTSIGSFLVSLHQLAFAVGAGFDPLYAAGVLGMGAFLGLPGGIAPGALPHRIGREAAAGLTYLLPLVGVARRSAERRGGEGCRIRWSPLHLKNIINNITA